MKPVNPASRMTLGRLDVPIESIHQRVPLAIGSGQEVALFERCAAGSGPA